MLVSVESSVEGRGWRAGERKRCSVQACWARRGTTSLDCIEASCLHCSSAHRPPTSRSRRVPRTVSRPSSVLQEMACGGGGQGGQESSAPAASTRRREATRRTRRWVVGAHRRRSSSDPSIFFRYESRVMSLSTARGRARGARAARKRCSGGVEQWTVEGGATADAVRSLHTGGSRRGGCGGWRPLRCYGTLALWSSGAASHATHGERGEETAPPHSGHSCCRQFQDGP